MPTKIGKIERLGRHGSRLTEAYLETGERVELSDEALAAAITYGDNASLVFVERRGRFTHYVQWVGTPLEAVRAVDQGILRADEVPESVVFMGRYELAFERMDLDRPERIAEALRTLPTVLPSGCNVPIASFAKLIDAVVNASDEQLVEVARRHDLAQDDVEWFRARSVISDAASKAGTLVQSAIWANPRDPGSKLEWRRDLPRAAYAVYQGVVALAEPRLTEAQRTLLYSPLETLAPRDIPRI